MSLPPVAAEVVVPVTPTAAFVGFTAQMGEWWDPLLSPDPATYTSVEMDPDGDVATVHDGERHVWGRVTTWEPDERYTQDFWLGLPDGQRSVLDVSFTGLDNDTATRVRLEHRDWPEGSGSEESLRQQWTELLARFAAFVK